MTEQDEPNVTRLTSYAVVSIRQGGFRSAPYPTYGNQRYAERLAAIRDREEPWNRPHRVVTVDTIITDPMPCNPDDPRTLSFWRRLRWLLDAPREFDGRILG